MALETWYHGTTLARAKKILQEGFKLDLCRRMTLGRGVYVTRYLESAVKEANGYEEEGAVLAILLDVKEFPLIENIPKWAIQTPKRGLELLRVSPDYLEASGYKGVRSCLKDHEDDIDNIVIYDLTAIRDCKLVEE